MKKIWLILVIVALVTVSFTGCKKKVSRTAFGGAAKVELIPAPAGTESLFLENASMAIYRFDIPAGTTWNDYSKGKITAEFMVDDKYITRYLRSGCVRLLGPYTEEELLLDYDPAEHDKCVINLADSMYFAERLISNVETTWEDLGAKPNEWFTVTYELSGVNAHNQWDDWHLPATDSKGPFWFALGLTSQDPGHLSGIMQLVRNITLHHPTDSSKNVVTKGSGMDVPAFASYYPVESMRDTNF